MGDDNDNNGLGNPGEGNETDGGTGGLNQEGSGGLNLGGSGINGWGDNHSDGMAEYNADHGPEDGGDDAAREEQSGPTEVESLLANPFQDYMREKVYLDPPKVNFDPEKTIFGSPYGSIETQWGKMGIPLSNHEEFNSGEEETKPLVGQVRRNPDYIPATDRYWNLPWSKTDVPEFSAISFKPEWGFALPSAVNPEKPAYADEPGNVKLAPFAKPVVDWMREQKIVDKNATYISGIPGETFRDLSPETQEKLRERFDPGWKSVIDNFGVPPAVGEAFAKFAPNASFLGRATGYVGLGYANAVYEKMNAPLQEHPGSLYDSLLDRAASGDYD